MIGSLWPLLLVPAIIARFTNHRVGSWRWTNVVSAMPALYSMCPWAWCRRSRSLPLLQPLAPTGTEPPFAISQGVVLLAFVAFTLLAVKRFYPPRDNSVISMRIP